MPHRHGAAAWGKGRPGTSHMLNFNLNFHGGGGLADGPNRHGTAGWGKGSPGMSKMLEF